MRDIDLLNAIIIRDLSAFNLFYAKYCHVLYSWAEKKLLFEEDLEDLLQNFWIWIWSYPEQVKTDEQGSAKSFLLHVLSCRIMDWIRKQSTSPVLCGEEWLDSSKDEFMYFHIQEEIDAKELLQEVRRQVCNMPIQARRIFRLRYVEHVPTKDIAARFSIAEGTVRNWNSWIMSNLKKKIKFN